MLESHNMNKCKNCNSKINITNQLHCKWCNTLYCIRCRNVEIHNCTGLTDCKLQYKNELKKMLMTHKSNKRKFDSI